MSRDGKYGQPQIVHHLSNNRKGNPGLNKNLLKQKKTPQTGAPIRSAMKKRNKKGDGHKGKSRNFKH